MVPIDVQLVYDGTKILTFSMALGCIFVTSFPYSPSIRPRSLACPAYLEVQETRTTAVARWKS